MTQSQFAELLCVQERTVQRWEAPGARHMCIHRSTELLLAVSLDDDDLAARMTAAGYRNPFARLAPA